MLGGNDGGGTVTPRLVVSAQAVEDFVERVAEGFDRDARDADIAWRDGKLDRTHARAGIETQRGELGEMVLARMKDPSAKRTIEVPVEVTETEAGRYKIQSKQVDPAWHAPNSDWAGELAGQTIPAGDPRNPLEARWMGFHDGQGIHGTSDIDSLGETASHGCNRMAVKDVKELYDEVERGTPVFVQ